MKPNTDAYRTTLIYPAAWTTAIDRAVAHMRKNNNPGATLNDVYREALGKYLRENGFLKDGDQK